MFPFDDYDFEDDDEDIARRRREAARPALSEEAARKLRTHSRIAGIKTWLDLQLLKEPSEELCMFILNMYTEIKDYDEPVSKPGL